MAEIRLVDPAEGLWQLDTLSAAQAEDYLSLDAGYELDGRQFVAVESRDLVGATDDLYIPVHAFERVDRALAEELFAVSDADRLVIRTCGTEPAPPFRRLLRYVTRQCAFAEGPAADVRDADERSAPFVRSMLRKALVDGYGDTPLDEEAVDAHLDRTVRFDGPDALHSLIAVHDGRDIGHITWTGPIADEVSGESFYDLVDVHVLPEFEGKNVTAALTTALVNRLAPEKAVLRGNVIETPGPESDRLYAVLLRAGWQPAYDLWVAYR